MTIKNNIINTTEVKEVAVMEEKKVTKVLDINREFVEKFAAEASVNDILWIRERTARLMEEKGEKAYFAAFRTEFAKRFIPEIIAEKKKPAKKPSMLDNLDKILAQKIAAEAV